MSTKKAVYREITIIRDDEREVTEDLIAVEKPVTIYLNGQELVTLLCTPEKIDRLALGFLCSEGLLIAADEVDSLRVLDEEGRVEVELKNDSGLAGTLFGKRTITSGCGKGTIFYNVLDSLRSSPITGKMQVTPRQLLSLVGKLQTRAELFRTTGGVHSAALADGKDIIIFFEDIGRHNAIDKIIGEALLTGMPTEDKIFVSSGRLSSEILLKAAKMKIQLLLSRAAPTSLCIELAENLNITLAGFARGKRVNIYTHRWRVLDS
ncbi:MAG: formate dehydrogenase accessory sulfurtransferase FdhD [Bacillota bacterium]|nr:formate dehydrogenase accessory sulfurtransferase FdhD [Bacillota bacterium]